MNDNRIKIVISGVEGVNKGAELMLYSILREIEKKHPGAVVYLPISQFPNGLDYIRTSLELRQSPDKLVRFLGKHHITGILGRLGFRSDYLYNLYPIKDAAYYLDASGLYFSDQMITSDVIAKDLEKLLKRYHQQGTKIIYLPQAFGPFQEQASKAAVDVALKCSDLVMARDDQSLSYLTSRPNSSDKVCKHFDFTGVLSGSCPPEYEWLAGRVCIILNSQVIRKGIMTSSEYLSLMNHIVQTIYNNGHKAFLLDHANDIDLIHQFLDMTSNALPVVSGVDALAVKGIISKSYLCISSRFHGVVSSFSSCVPCLTTSWNHKYQELLKLYNMEDSLLSGSQEECISRVKNFLSKRVNDELRNKLREKKGLVHHDIEEMWEKVWSI